MRCAVDADVVFDKECNKLLPVHETHTDGVGPLGLAPSAWAEAAGRDDEPLLVCAERPTHLLDRRRLYIVVPTLDLDGHADANNIAHHQCPAHVDTAVASPAGHLDFVKAHRREELADERLKCVGRCRLQAGEKLGSHSGIVLLDRFAPRVPAAASASAPEIHTHAS